ncbi:MULTISPECIES: hypothetical protein [unclassified Nostoc]|uniref:hypothetical protein n=1 Tax=unclassified Nostoc TaxID=2593658 RepID=UPI002AD2C700|nr:hypothetical protein [Nostoc sp. DedQUE03]MDZ7975774.1 hypothetical protein [Nostoc sp. DedQUE03]MDZ8048307.1 hypothetical protein [Nostoc sp. DedQUE02]
MNNQENLDIPHPDPSWDYYLIYHRLLKAKYELDKLIHCISEIESATDESDNSINEDLFDLVSLLENSRIPVELVADNEE